MTQSLGTMGRQINAASDRNLNTILSGRWARTERDHRYPTLAALLEATTKREAFVMHSRLEPQTVEVRADASDVMLEAPFVRGSTRSYLADINSHAFGQLAQKIKAPAAYLQTLPPALAAANIKFGLDHRGEQGKEAKFYLLPRLDAQGERITGPDLAGRPEAMLHAVLGPDYGFISDAKVVRALVEMNDRAGGIWVVPNPDNNPDPIAASTLYAGERNMFAFLVDTTRPIIGPDGSELYRLICVWNSEVGDRTFGVTVGTYRYICKNRMVWGGTEVFRFALRHTKMAPERFRTEVEPAILAYAQSSSAQLERQMKKAAETPLRLANGKVADTTETQIEWLTKHGFGEVLARTAVDLAQKEEGGSGSLWEISQGVTAAARGFEQADQRFDIEQRIGKIVTEATKGVEAPFTITVPAMPAATNGRADAFLGGLAVAGR